MNGSVCAHAPEGNQCAGEVYIGSILLEPNRWTQPKRPSYLVSEWLERFERSGFDGIELWEYHATLCSPGELAAIERSPVPIKIFNSYASFDDQGGPARDEAVRQVERLRAGGVKFNLGGRWEERETYLRHLVPWARRLPPGVRILCECHPGTIMEVPGQAAEVFARLEELGATGQRDTRETADPPEARAAQAAPSPAGSRGPAGALSLVGIPEPDGTPTRHGMHDRGASGEPGEVPPRAGGDSCPELLFQVIVHPFYTEAHVLKEFFRLFGARITHAHVQMRDGDRFLCLDENPALAKERLQLLRDEGFRGSFTLEFTAGTNTPEENREALYAAAERDLAFLREHWT